MAMGGPKSGGEEGDEIFAEINITPLTDIFLVLLIIFMVTSSIVASDAARAGVKVNLPKGSAKEISASAKDITIAVTTDGKIIVDGKETTADQLKARFDAANAQNPDTMVIVQADENAHHGKVVSVMELARASGLHHLAIATRPGSK
jgi:biopolymer transport protein ExbD